MYILFLPYSKQEMNRKNGYKSKTGSAVLKSKHWWEGAELPQKKVGSAPRPVPSLMDTIMNHIRPNGGRQWVCGKKTSF